MQGKRHERVLPGLGDADLNAAGWDALVADVRGTASGSRSRLLSILSRPVGVERPWSRQRLDVLWASAHGSGAAASD